MGNKMKCLAVKDEAGGILDRSWDGQVDRD